MGDDNGANYKAPKPTFWDIVTSPIWVIIIFVGTIILLIRNIFRKINFKNKLK